MTITCNRNKNNKTKIITFCNILSSPFKSMLAVLIIIAFGNSLSLVIGATTSPPPPCLSGWSHLSHSQICIKLHGGGSALYVDTVRLCSTAAEDDQTGVSPFLLGFQNVAAGDFHTLDTVVGDGVNQLWFYVVDALPQQAPISLLQKTPITATTSMMNYSSCLAVRNRTSGFFHFLIRFSFF